MFVYASMASGINVIKKDNSTTRPFCRDLQSIHVPSMCRLMKIS